MRSIRFFLGVALATFLTLPSGGLDAQNVTVRYNITPYQGKAAAFEAALKEHVAYRSAVGDTWNWTTLQMAAGAELGEYVIISGGHTWADVDAYEATPAFMLMQQHWFATVQPLVEEVGMRFNVNNTDLSNPRPAGDPARIIGATRYWIAPTQMSTFLEAVGMFAEALRGGDMYWSVTQPVSGGAGGTMLIAGLGDSWDDIRRNDEIAAGMNAHYGEARAAEITQMFFGSFLRTQEYVLRYREDLSLTGN
jgi:hypothetical protein